MSDPNDLNVALFLFAHQDDEFGIFQKILDEQNRGRKVICAYLTDGHFHHVSAEVRNQESIAVLTKLGVMDKNIFFAGDELGIQDSSLPENIEIAAVWLRDLFRSLPKLVSVYVPAWEGGHQDHDALHAITVLIAQEFSVLSCVRQFSLYNNYRCVGSFFRVFRPLPFNGEVVRDVIGLKNRMRFLKYCLSYPSQWLTWIGLFPFVLLHYVVSGTQQLQAVQLERIVQRPHHGDLYYEKRGFFTWQKMIECVSKLMDIDTKK